MTSTPALIETVRVRRGVAPLWYLHLRRLVASCRALGVPFPAELEVPEGGADRVHRLLVSARGVEVSEREPGDDRPLRVVTSSVPHEPYPHKTTDRNQFDRAAADARACGADDALLVTRDGFVAEGTIWCLFWWEGDTLCAPARDLGILPGVSRARVEELVPVTERRVGPTGLVGRALFLTNAARGVVAVEEFNGRAVPDHPGTAALRERFWG
jgi:branched-subunit amino acid aminotransferase/4-amino-4-deoxychorismate lyase